MLTSSVQFSLEEEAVRAAANVTRALLAFAAQYGQASAEMEFGLKSLLAAGLEVKI